MISYTLQIGHISVGNMKGKNMFSLYNIITFYKYKKAMLHIVNVCSDEQDTIDRLTIGTNEFMEQCIWANKADGFIKVFILMTALIIRISDPSAANTFAEIMMFALWADSIMNYCVAKQRLKVVSYYRDKILRYNKEKCNDET